MKINFVAVSCCELMGGDFLLLFIFPPEEKKILAFEGEIFDAKIINGKRFIDAHAEFLTKLCMNLKGDYKFDGAPFLSPGLGCGCKPRPLITSYLSCIVRKLSKALKTPSKASLQTDGFNLIIM